MSRNQTSFIFSFSQEKNSDLIFLGSEGGMVDKTLDSHLSLSWV